MKKRGKKINQTACCRPLGVKATDFELNARMSLVALERGEAIQDNMVNFYVLADIVQRLGGADGELIDALCEEITRLRNKEALVTSSDKWIFDHDQQVRDAALKDAAEQCRQIAEWNNDIPEYQQAAEWCRDLILEMRVVWDKQNPECTRSHPHEQMDAVCKEKSISAKARNELANAKYEIERLNKQVMVLQEVAWMVDGGITMREDFAAMLGWKGAHVGIGRAIPNAWTPMLYSSMASPNN